MSTNETNQKPESGSTDCSIPWAERVATMSIHPDIANRQDIAKMASEIMELRRALSVIERWHGEFPSTGKFWDDDEKRPMSYVFCYGSNGERDYMRDIARKTLKGLSTERYE